MATTPLPSEHWEQSRSPSTRGRRYDTLILNGVAGINTLSQSAFTGATHLITQHSRIENFVINGSPGNDDIYIHDVSEAADTIVINGGEGADNCILSNTDLPQSITDISNFMFNGGNGSDGLTVSNASNNSMNWSYGIYSSYTNAFAAGYYLGLNYDSVESVSMHGSMRADTFVVASGAPSTIVLNGYDGGDYFIIGKGLSLRHVEIGNGNDSFVVGGGNVVLPYSTGTLSGGPATTRSCSTIRSTPAAANWAINSTGVQRNIPGLRPGLQLRRLRRRRHQDRHRRGRHEQHHHVWRHPRQRHRDRRRRPRQLLHQQLCQRSGRRTLPAPSSFSRSFDGGGGFNQLIVNDRPAEFVTYSMYPTRLKIIEVLADDGDFSFAASAP